MLKLADPDGVVDMTQEAIAARARLPLEMVRDAIKELEAPDPRSRSSEQEGKRIVLMDPHRDWGWVIVNYSVYREMRLEFDRKSYMRKYMKENRPSRSKVKQQVNPSLTSFNQVNRSPYTSVFSKDGGMGEGFRKRLWAILNRPEAQAPTLHESSEMECLFRREGITDELATIEQYKQRLTNDEKGYFPRTFGSLICRWTDHLDAARNYVPQSVSLEKKIKLLEDHLANHTANRESIRHNKNASDAEKEDFKRKKEQLDAWKIKAIR